MSRASFEYDEVGNTFYYVLISFYALILVPVTYIFLRPSKQEEVKVNRNECQCEPCLKKRTLMSSNEPWKKTKKTATFVILALAWLIFALLCKKVTEIEVTHEEYDPYNILGLDQGASTSEVKKAYREMSKTHHPDRGGDAQLFDRIAKAYQALTDEESKENWEKYGNPDGPTATTFGIALPKWIVSSEYGSWVLAAYGLLFGVLMPSVVGYWWYNSIKYNADKVLLDTTQLFYYFIHKTPKMEVNRMLMVLLGAFEFWKQYNKEIVERETDDVELPRMMKQLPALGENKKERPLSLPYALKARILGHMHLSRLSLGSDVLEFDQRYVLARCLRLVEEMITLSQQMTFYGQVKVPFETLENMLKLQPMFVQALWPKNSPLLQLPHLTEYNLQYLRKGKIGSCSALAAMESDKRRSLLKSLDDDEYNDIMVVLSQMPRLSIDTQIVVEGEDDAHEVTAGSYVTLKVTLKRSTLIEPKAIGSEDLLVDSDDASDLSDSENADADGQLNGNPEDDNKPKRKPWEKNKPKKKGVPNKKKNKPPVKKVVVVPTAHTTVEEEKEEQNTKAEDGDRSDDNDDEDSGSSSESPLNNKDDDSDFDEEHWEPSKKKNVFETKSYKTHIVHSPYYPVEKYEWWWLTLCYTDKKLGKGLATTVTNCRTLVDEQTIDMRFEAPHHKGVYNFQLCVRSDSYMDAVYLKDIKVDVKEAKEIVLPKYEDTDDEEKKDDASSEEEYTEDDDSDVDD